MTDELILTNARLVLPGSVVAGTIVLRERQIAEISEHRSAVPGSLDMDGDYLIPGVVDVHTDNLERQVQPRSNARWPSRSAMIAHDAQCAAAGVTTVLDALCIGDLGFSRMTASAPAAKGSPISTPSPAPSCSRPSTSCTFAASCPRPTCRICSILSRTIRACA